MSLNWREIDTILSELSIIGSHIQKVKQPDYSSLIFDLYHPESRFALYICLTTGRTRLNRLTKKFNNPPVLQRFAQFLRSRCRNGKIVEVKQIGRERIVKLQVLRGGVSTNLWIRLWGGAGNVIATDDRNIILDAFYRRPKKKEISGAFFNPEEEFYGVEYPEEDRYNLRELPGETSFNERIEAYYFLEEESTAADNRREKILKRLEKEASRLEATLGVFGDKKDFSTQAEEHRKTGDLLMSNLHRIERSASSIEVEDFERPGHTLIIELDPRITARENAQARYRRYRKAKAAGDRAREERKRLESELAMITKQRTKIADMLPQEILALEEGKFGTPGRIKSTEKADRRPPGIRIQSRGYTIYVGRSAQENDDLLREWVRGNDFWLHTREGPGAYVFIKSKQGKSVPLEVLLDAGHLAVYHSKARKAGEAELYYTRVKYLRRVKNGKKGLVIPTQEKNLSIKLDSGRLAAIKAGADSL